MKKSEHEIDSDLMDELMAAMGDVEGKKLFPSEAKPAGSVVEIHIHPPAGAETPEEEKKEAEEMTPEEMDELLKGAE